MAPIRLALTTLLLGSTFTHLPAQITAAMAKVSQHLYAKRWGDAFDVLIDLETRELTSVQLKQVCLGFSETADGLQAARDFDRALRAHRGAVATAQRREQDADRELATCRNNLALCLQAMDRDQESVAELEAARKIWEALDDDAELANCMQNLAVSLRKLGRPAEALDRAKQALAIRERLAGAADEDAVAGVRSEVGACLRELGRLEEAMPLLRSALAAREATLGPSDHRTVATAAILAACETEAGDFAGARVRLETLLQRARAAPDAGRRPDTAHRLNDLAHCLTREGRHREALPLAQEAVQVAIAAHGEHHGDVALMRHNLGECLLWLGQPSLALEQIEASRTVRLAMFGGSDRPEIAQSEGVLGGCLQALGRDEEALVHHQRALTVWQRIHGGSPHPHLGLALNNVASCLADLDRVDEAIETFETALAMWRMKRGGSKLDVPIALNNLGSCLVIARRPAEALPYCESALQEWRALFGETHTRTALAIDNLGCCLTILGRHEDALAHLQRALAIRVDLFRSMDHPALVDSLNHVAECLFQMGRPEEALAHAERAVASVERMRAAERLSPELAQASFDALKRNDTYERYQLISLRLARKGEALHAAERSRGRALLELFEQNRVDPVERAYTLAIDRGDSQSAAAIARVRSELDAARLERDQLLHDLVGNSPSATDARLRTELTAKAQTIGDRIRRLQDDRARLVGDGDTASRVPAIAELQAMLGDDECLIEFTVDDVFAVLYVLERNSVDAFVLPTAAATVRRVVPILRTACSRVRSGRGRDGDAPTADPGSIEAESRTLFASLFPEAAWQRIRRASRVFVAAHGDLHRLPFEILVVGDAKSGDTTWLDAGPPIAYVPSASALHWLRTRRQDPGRAPSLQMLVVGDPGPRIASTTTSRDGDLERLRHLGRLDGARAEARAIGAAFAAKSATAEVLLDERATETATFDLAAGARFLHFACHGLAEEYANRSLSMLVLSQPAAVTARDDGLLKLDDLLHAWRGRLAACDLVVLSACHTNVGPTLRDEAPQALPIGFFFSGAPSVVSSLWAVDDASTRELMTDFYSRLLAGETDKLVAFTAAKKALRAKHPQPFHWAPFLFLGCPR